MKLIAKHLPLLALALLVSSTQLRAEELPFKVGDRINVVKVGESGGARERFKVAEIKGKWVKMFSLHSEEYDWYNTDQFLEVKVE